MSRSASARLFAAVDPPAAVCEQLAAWAREATATLRGRGAPAEGTKARLLAPETMHVTLCFLGGRPAEEIETLAAALAACPAPAVGELSLGAPLWLPPRDPRTLALAVGDPEGRLQRLAQAVSDAFAAAVAWEPERRRFRAHVTVARLGRGGGPPSRRGRGGRRGGGGGTSPGSGRDDGERMPLPPTPQLRFVPREVVLYRSRLDPQGARYEPLAARALSASPSAPASSSPSSSPSPAGEEGEDEP